MAFWNPGSRGGANTGMTCRARHRRLIRPTVSTNLMRPLEDRSVVELRVGGQPLASPALPQGLERGLCAHALHDPRVRQRAMQARGGEHRDERPLSDLQVLDEVKAVEFGLPAGEIGQIPALGGAGCGAAGVLHRAPHDVQAPGESWRAKGPA